MSTKLRPLEENIARLEAANEETRAVVREAHEAIQSAKLVLRDLRAEREQLAADIRGGFDAAIGQQVSDGLASFTETIKRQTEAAHDHVIRQFDRLYNIMLYGNEQGRGPNLVVEWVRKVVREELARSRRGVA